MPVYNGERWVRQAVDSILGQTHRELELVICDNASSDATERICRRYADVDPRVRYYRNSTNVGLNENYNLTFRRATGEYFKWASCNDVCAPQLIERCVWALETHRDVVLCYARTRIIGEHDDSGELYEDDVSVQQDYPYERMRHILERVKLNNIVNGVVRADVLARTRLLGDYFASDIPLLVELALHGKFLELPEDLFYRRMTTEAATKLKTQEDLLTYYHPGLHKQMLFPRWKLNGGCLAAVTRAPLTAGERTRAYAHLLRRIVWDRRKLARDILVAGRALIGRRG